MVLSDDMKHDTSQGVSRNSWVDGALFFFNKETPTCLVFIYFTNISHINGSPPGHLTWNLTAAGQLELLSNHDLSTKGSPCFFFNEGRKGASELLLQLVDPLWQAMFFAREMIFLSEKK